MKRPLIIIAGGGLIASAIVFVILQLNTKKKYDDVTGFFQTTSVISVAATEEDDQFVAQITNEWDKHEGRGMSHQDLQQVLQLADFPNTLAGLVAFQTHVVPPYSYFDHERNKKETVRAATMNVGSPIGKGELVVSSTYAYHKQRSGLVHLFTVSDGGIQHVLYTEPKEAQQGGTGQPATRTESKSEGGDKPQPESEGRSR